MASSTHKTEPSKIAALTCVSIALVNPVRPLAPPDVPDYVVAYANPMFAMRCACSIVEHPFHRRSWEDRARFYDGLRDLHFSSFDRYIEDSNQGIRKLLDPMKFELGREEMRLIEDKIMMFTVLQELKIYRDVSQKNDLC